MSLQLCPLCESVLYRVEPENGSFVAYDQESGAVVPPWGVRRPLRLWML